MDDNFSHIGSGNDADAADEAGAARRRATERDSLFLHATLCRDSDEPLTVRVRNLSAGGMMAEIGDPFVKGDHVAIELRGIGPLDGSVAWRTDTRIGIAFAHEIDPRLARKSVALRPAARAPAPAPRTVRRPKLFGD